jgi:hypothetical protein
MKKLILFLALIINLSAFSQDDKTVTLIVSGQGKTQDEARQNALRSAIEQAFGTFISSKTEILNDNLVKDEIVSIANGNIQKFDIISEVQIPDGGYASTLKATVSVTKLTSFVERKGMSIIVNGSLFAENIKQFKINEEAELKTVSSLTYIVLKYMQTSFDFNLKVEDPKSIDNENDKWKIGLSIEVIANKNADICANYFINTLTAINVTSTEIENYKKLNKRLNSIKVRYNRKDYLFNLRNENSAALLSSIFTKWEEYIRGFYVLDGTHKIKSRTSSNSHKSIYGEGYFISGLLFPKTGIMVGSFSWDEYKTLKELEIMTGYSVKPIDFTDIKIND